MRADRGLIAYLHRHLPTLQRRERVFLANAVRPSDRLRVDRRLHLLNLLEENRRRRLEQLLRLRSRLRVEVRRVRLVALLLRLVGEAGACEKPVDWDPRQVGPVLRRGHRVVETLLDRLLRHALVQGLTLQWKEIWRQQKCAELRGGGIARARPAIAHGSGVLAAWRRCPR